MIRTPYHLLLSRHDYDLLRHHPGQLLDRVHWVEERPEALGPDAPVRLFYRDAEQKQDHQREILRALASCRSSFTDHDTD